MPSNKNSEDAEVHHTSKKVLAKQETFLQPNCGLGLLSSMCHLANSAVLPFSSVSKLCTVSGLHIKKEADPSKTIEKTEAAMI